MKKAISIITVAILVLGLMNVTVFAHGHRGSGTTTPAYKLCSLENCNVVGNHKHNGIVYTGHSMSDGHNYHQLCNIKSCNKSLSHQHNSQTYLPHTSQDGHHYHKGSGSNHGGHH